MAHRDESQPGADARRARLLSEFMARIAPSAPSAPKATERLDRAAADLFRALEPAGVDALLLKGPALEQALYGPGERRSYVDVDVLVAPEDRATARRTLSELGYVDAHKRIGIDDVGGVVHAETWIAGPDADCQGTLIELHLWLPGTTGDPQEVWDVLGECHGWVEVQGLAVPCLGRPALAMGLALHAAQHGPIYKKGLAELALGLERWPSDVWAAASGLAARTGAVEAFAAGLRLVPEGADLARALDLPATDRADWEIRNARARPRGTFHLRAFMDAESTSARLSVARRSLFPKRAWIMTERNWARRGGWRIPAAYTLHLTRAPLWAFRAWRFRRRSPC
jgi:hypothetical protein